MKLTKKWLTDHDACRDGVAWYLKQNETDLIKILKALCKRNSFDWFNWLITKKFTKMQNVRYACYAAKQVLANFEKKYPGDKRPRQAINAALQYAKNPTAANRSAARSAASAAWSAAWSAESAESAAWRKTAEYGMGLLSKKVRR